MSRTDVVSLPRATPEVKGARWRVDLALLDRERVRRAWTRGELARRAHVDPGTLSDMFRRKRRPVLGTIQSLCIALNLTLDEAIIFEKSHGEQRLVA